mgnify:CR=1 FL=1
MVNSCKAWNLATIKEEKVRWHIKQLILNTNEILATFDNATDEALEELWQWACAYKKWRAEGGLAERKAQLRKIAELLRRDVDKYAEVMTKDMGKLFVEAKGEVDLCAEIADYYADKAEEIFETTST